MGRVCPLAGQLSFPTDTLGEALLARLSFAPVSSCYVNESFNPHPVDLDICCWLSRTLRLFEIFDCSCFRGSAGK